MIYFRDPETLLGHERGRQEVSVQRSRICYNKTGIGVFVWKDAEERNVVGSYYGSLAYADLGEELQETKKVGREVLKDHHRTISKVGTGSGQGWYWQEEADLLCVGGSGSSVRNVIHRRPPVSA